MKKFIHYVYIDLFLAVIWMSMLLIKPLSRVKTYNILKSYSVVTLNIIFNVMSCSYLVFAILKVKFSVLIVGILH